MFYLKQIGRNWLGDFWCWREGGMGRKTDRQSEWVKKVLSNLCTFGNTWLIRIKSTWLICICHALKTRSLEVIWSSTLHFGNFLVPLFPDTKKDGVCSVGIGGSQGACLGKIRTGGVQFGVCAPRHGCFFLSQMRICAAVMGCWDAAVMGCWDDKDTLRGLDV